MKQLVVVADDLGLTESVNFGVIKSRKEGLVTEVSLMLNSPGTEHAVLLSKEEKVSDIGLHLLLRTENDRPLPRKDDYIELFKSKTGDEVRSIAMDELGQFVKLIGRQPTHIIPQYGIHGNLKLLEILIDYSKKYGIPMRMPRTALMGKIDENYAAEIMLRRSGVITTNHLFSRMDRERLIETKKYFVDQLKKVKDGETVEILFHPGYFDEKLLKMSSLNYERGRDLALCMDQDFAGAIAEMDFEIVSYGEIEA